MNNSSSSSSSYCAVREWLRRVDDHESLAETRDALNVLLEDIQDIAITVDATFKAVRKIEEFLVDSVNCWDDNMVEMELSGEPRTQTLQPPPAAMAASPEPPRASVVVTYQPPAHAPVSLQPPTPQPPPPTPQQQQLIHFQQPPPHLGLGYLPTPHPPPPTPQFQEVNPMQYCCCRCHH